MKTILFLILNLLGDCAVAQQQRLFFAPMNDYYLENKYISTSYATYPAKDKEFILNEREKSTNYCVLRIQIQKDSTQNINTFIDILGGATEKGNMFLVADINRNKNFKDDSVYVVKMDKNFEKRSDYIKAWPEIMIDTIHYYYHDTIITSPLLLSTALFPSPGFNYFKNSEEVLNSKNKFVLHIFRNKNLQSFFYMDSSTYKLNIELFPFYVPVYKFFLEDSQMAFHQVSFYKHTKKNDSLVYRTSLSEIVESLKTGNPIEVDKNEIQFLKLSLKESFIDVNILNKQDSLIKAKHKKPITVKKINGFSIKENKVVELKMGVKKYRILFFSGSWCIPCHEAQNGFKLLFLKYYKEAEFVTIAYEKTIKDARNYYNRYKPQWRFLYENNTSKSSSLLTNKLKIIIFPSFILLDNKGNILYHGDSSTSIAAIDTILAHHIK